MTLPEVLNRNLLFVGGKGGVGKTVVSQAIALNHASRSKRTLWVTFEDPTRPMGKLKQINNSLWHINCDPTVGNAILVSPFNGIPVRMMVLLLRRARLEPGPFSASGGKLHVALLHLGREPKR